MPQGSVEDRLVTEPEEKPAPTRDSRGGVRVTFDPMTDLGLSPADVEEIGREFDELRLAVAASLGEKDSRYIHTVLRSQRVLEVVARIGLIFAKSNTGAVGFGALLALSKIVENFEVGHNVLHGQWDWMNDPEIHSSTYEWDMVCPAELWKHSHNVVHHVNTNVVGLDRDLGYTILRVKDEQRHTSFFAYQIFSNVALALLFEWGFAVHDLELEDVWSGRADKAEFRRKRNLVLAKAGRQYLKELVINPALGKAVGNGYARVAAASIGANLVRNLWMHVTTMCGHHPDGTMLFPKSVMEDESRGHFYIRQLVGSANFNGGGQIRDRAIDFLSGHLSKQIEHHLYPDLPTSRMPELSTGVKEICAKWNLPYIEGNVVTQYTNVWLNVIRLRKA